jgi:hypothetical protein
MEETPSMVISAPLELATGLPPEKEIPALLPKYQLSACFWANREREGMSKPTNKKYCLQGIKKDFILSDRGAGLAFVRIFHSLDKTDRKSACSICWGIRGSQFKHSVRLWLEGRFLFHVCFGSLFFAELAKKNYCADINLTETKYIRRC